MNWRELAEREAFHEFDWFHQPEEDWPEILELMRAAVPTRRESHGIEVRDRHLKPHEVEDAELNGRNKAGLKAAALALRELEAAIEGDPPDASTEWSRISKEQRAYLSRLLEQPEVTEGEPTMSRAAYARDAIELLDEIERRFRWYVAAELARATADPDGEEPSDGPLGYWLSEALSDVVLLAYGAGQRSRAAWGKDWEKDAVTYLRNLAPFKKANDDRRGQLSPQTKQILDEISRILSESLDKAEAGAARISAAQAADIVFRRGLGSSPEANRQLWQKYKKNL